LGVVRWQITQLGWETRLESPKTDSREAYVPLDNETVAVLRVHLARQDDERAHAGLAWEDNDLAFTDNLGRISTPPT
jgi:hypothetical protein